MISTHHHIDAFNRIVLKLFIRLYDAFPHPQNINIQTATDLGFDLFKRDIKEDENVNVGTVANDMMEWLREEGFIRYDPDPNYRPGTFWKVRLTLKGVTVLGYTRASLRKTDPMEPLIQKAKHVITSAETPSGTEAVRRVVEEIFIRTLTSVPSMTISS